MIVLTIVVVIAAVVLILVNQKKPTPVAMEITPRASNELVALRSRASWEVETEEDLDVIRDRYWHHRRQERADEAMTRLGALVPVSKSK